ncbi:GRB2-related adapter protein-like isoform X2 [Gouania willdenowi]|uniref:GRB2-related adapter protein-like isoform X2 n=1 Tax=Gouania willdenowi TaxID=441366 RepID=UPI001056D63C|nr:GRB2-related adapter protein-like isoform X2 [Gouania willdenowi]
MEAVALFSFTASGADEISFKKGDVVKVTEMEDDSCWLTAEIHGKRGYVPENYISLLPHPYGDRVEHFRVLEGGGQYCIWDESFSSLNQLVDFYRSHSIAVDKVIHLRDPPSQTHVGHNPYPNPYRTSSQESIPSARLHPRTEKEPSQRVREPVLEKPRLAHALCNYTPPLTNHLHFRRGDIIDLLDCSNSLSWRGRCRGRVGIFPPEFVQALYH